MFTAYKGFSEIRLFELFVWTCLLLLAIRCYHYRWCEYKYHSRHVKVCSSQCLISVRNKIILNFTRFVFAWFMVYICLITLSRSSKTCRFRSTFFDVIAWQFSVIFTLIDHKNDAIKCSKQDKQSNFLLFYGWCWRVPSPHLWSFIILFFLCGIFWFDRLKLQQFILENILLQQST